MLITKQPKKANSNIRYSLGNNNSIINNNPGKPIKKNKKVKEKLNTNLSQLYINLNNHTKENASLANLMMGRPHSSLVASDVSGSLSKSKDKDINIFCKDKIKLKKDNSKRNSLAVGDAPNRNRKASGCSNSFNKWNNRSVQEDTSNFKLMMAENRKKYNLSCGEMVENKSKTKQFSMKPKKKSGQVEKSIIKGPSKKKLSKKPQIENKKFKPANLHKSKGSTANINQTQNLGKTKKKQKQNKPKQRSKSKNKKNIKSTKMFILSKGDTKELKQSEQQYPINKYFDIKQKPKKSLNIKVGLDYNFLGNIVSMSSGALYDESSGSVEKNHHFNNFLLLDNKIYEKQPSDTINLEQIRYYEENSPIKKSQQIKNLIHNRVRSEIRVQLQQQYPYLNSQQLKFLSCVVYIQRKWRQYMVKIELKRAREIVTEYVADETQKSKEHMLKKQKSWFESDIEKTNVIAKTKLASFESEQNKETVSKNRLMQLISSHELQSRKNSSNKEVIIYSNDPSSYQLRSNVDENQNNLTDRKPYTDKSQVQGNYSWKVSKEVFPQICYLQYRRNTLKDQLTKTIKIMTQDKKMKKITQSEYEQKKGTVIQQYEKQISSLKKTKYDIKKGYLRYIDCLNHIKDSKQSEIQERLGSKYGIRKVSSQSNFLSNLYEKIFKFDGCISEWSGASQSVEILTKKILIRKQYYKKEGNRRSLSDVRSAGRNSFDAIKSTREHLNYTLALVEKTDREAPVENTAKLGLPQDIFETESKHIRQFKISKQSWKIDSKQNLQRPINQEHYGYENTKQVSELEITNNKPHINQNQQQKKLQVNEISKSDEKQQVTKQKMAFNLHLNRLTNSISLFQSQDQELVRRVENEVILHLTKELEADIHEINPVLVDIILINQPELSFYDRVEVEEADEDEAIEINSYQKNRQWYQIQQNSPAMRNLHHQLQGMTSPRENEFHFRNPYIPETQPEKAFEYVSGLIYFITKKKWLNEILYNVNNSQTFSPLSYLKFLRDFQIPDEEEYIPIISNEKFIEWENVYSNQRKISSFFGSSEEIQVLKQSETIFHRCLFQVFLSQLQKHRAYGERGRPFPWESKYSYSTIRQVTINEIEQVFARCLRKVEQYLIYKCGIISEKLILSNEQQLQRAHQQNQDRIIEMLEQDLMESNHQWYQIQEHSLEIKLELTFLIEQAIFNEVIEAVKIFGL